MKKTYEFTITDTLDYPITEIWLMAKRSWEEHQEFLESMEGADDLTSTGNKVKQTHRIFLTDTEDRIGMVCYLFEVYEL